MTPAVLDGLVAAFAKAKGIDPGDVSGPISGSVHYGYVAATSVYWATAQFTPSPNASSEVQVSFQDAGNAAVFWHKDGSQWSATVGHIPWPCPTDVPDYVLTAWGMTFSNSCVFKSPTPAQLDSLIVDSSAMPQGFVHEDTPGGPGQQTSVGPSLGTVSGHWVRYGSPPNQDYISVFLNLFSSGKNAIDYNSVFSKEYTGSGPILQQTTVSGVPASTAYMNGGSSGGGPGSSALASPPTASAWFNVGGVAVGVYVSDYHGNPLPIAEQLAVAQYKRLADAAAGG